MKQMIALDVMMKPDETLLESQTKASSRSEHDLFTSLFQNDRDQYGNPERVWSRVEIKGKEDDEQDSILL